VEETGSQGEDPYGTVEETGSQGEDPYGTVEETGSQGEDPYETGEEAGYGYEMDPQEDSSYASTQTPDYGSPIDSTNQAY
jgi:hypothetical protein